jgi:hypothetical protein
MGLDMYAGTLSRQPETPVDFTAEGSAPLHYWRKHPDLHGWMESLYREKGGGEQMFNCVTLQLTADDLDRLERDLKGTSLPDTTGFFFGESDGTETEDDLAFISAARAAIGNGLAVFYTSWW